MRVTGGPKCQGDTGGRCTSPTQPLSNCGSVCISNVLQGMSRWACLALLALKNCKEKWHHTFHHGWCSSSQCLWSVPHCQCRKREEIKILRSPGSRKRLHQSYMEKFLHDLPRFAAYKHEQQTQLLELNYSKAASTLFYFKHEKIATLFL